MDILQQLVPGARVICEMGGKLSTDFCEKQGVRQGGIWSPTAYKHFLNPLLNGIAENNVGLQIGSIYCGLVGVADDVLFMADDTEDLNNVSYMYIVNMPKRNDTKLVILKLRGWYLIQNQKWKTLSLL